MTNRTRFRARARAGHGGVSYDAEAQAYIARAGITDPTYADATLALVTRLKGFSLWSKLDWLILFGNENSTAAIKNLIRDDFHATLINSPTITPGVGMVTVHNSNKSAAVDYDPATDAVALTLNSAVLFAWVESSTRAYPNDAGFIIGATGSNGKALDIRPNYGNDNPGYDINSDWTGNIAAGVVQADYAGFFCANRTGAGALSLRKNGTQIGSSTKVAAALPDMGAKGIGVGANTFGSTSTQYAFGGTISAAGMGGGMSNEDADNLYMALSEYRTAIGL